MKKTDKVEHYILLLRISIYNVESFKTKKHADSLGTACRIFISIMTEKD